INLQFDDISSSNRSMTIQRVPPGVKTLKVYLDWSGHQHSGTDSLTLTITLQGSTALGPCRDGADGRMDERISLTLSGSTPLPSGTWKFLIFGEDVPPGGNGVYAECHLLLLRGAGPP
ncbi:MAG: hypothetical protein WAR36_10575, partial [Candidatus Methanoculleus thermohydrogenotrophicum]